MKNMYDFIYDTRNFIGGECPHKCRYCYVEVMKKRSPVIMNKYSGEPRLYKKEFKKGFAKGKTYFIGSMIDMFAQNIFNYEIANVIDYCKQFNIPFLFQSKNPERFLNFNFPIQTILGTTIETNRDYNLSQVPDVRQRAKAMSTLSNCCYTTMITIEPVCDFDEKEMVDLISMAAPTWVNIGADSKKNNLPEPSWKKVQALILELSKFTEVRQKTNLNRLMK